MKQKEEQVNHDNSATHDKPFVTVDVLIFSIIDDDLKIALVKRKAWPYKDDWALPGGFVKMNESLEHAAFRELEEETGVKEVYLEQLYTFGAPSRDPRGRIITISYFALMPSKGIHLAAASDAIDAKWFSLNNVPSLAFDHRSIISYGLERLRAKIQYSTIVYGLLPERFKLSELQKVYEIILNKKLDKRNFRKKMLSLELLSPIGEKEAEGAHRPAMLYRFKERGVIFFD